MNYKEIHDALLKVMEARATTECCVNFTEEDIDNADLLYYECKRYVEAYKKARERDFR